MKEDCGKTYLSRRAISTLFNEWASRWIGNPGSDFKVAQDPLTRVRPAGWRDEGVDGMGWVSLSCGCVRVMELVEGEVGRGAGR